MPPRTPPQYTPVEIRERRLAVLVTAIPFFGTSAALFLAWRDGFGAANALLLLPLYVLCEIGAEVGHHRLFSHGAFRAHPVVRAALAILASMSGKGSVFEFAAVHRRHHHYSDREGDPHSPHRHGPGFFGSLKGLWHSYYGWLFVYPMSPSEHAWVIDLLQDRLLVKIARKEMYYVWLVLGTLIPAAFGAVLLGSWPGAATGFLWGGMVRLFLEQHSAYAVNAVGHFFGSRPFRTADKSVNNTVLAYLTLGVGWHNNHHAFPSTAYNQFEWWQFDPCGWIIRGLEALGLVWDCQFPKLRQRQAKSAALHDVSR